MPPFRTGADHALAPAAASAVVRDAVGQMVRQFADPFAFYRELVQNSIDAGAQSIHVTLGHEPEEAIARVAVADDGAGMDRETIERCLLVLFRSSKDGDASKIGKFGVGFFSVFAMAPARVVVETGDGATGFRLLLRPDYAYELSAAAPRRGTTVTLEVPATLDAARTLVATSVDALVRWCPHVRVPLTFASSVPGAAQTHRIDRPFGIDAPAAVVDRDEDGAQYAAAVARVASAEFYNRGILIHRVEGSLFRGVALKVDSAALSHTLSRDDVRRDRAWDRAVARAQRLVSGPLGDAVVAAFNAGAEAAGAATDRERVAQFGALALLVHAGGYPVAFDRLRWPVHHALASGAYAVGAADRAGVPRFTAPAPSGITRALAAAGSPVANLDAVRDGVQREALRRLFAASPRGRSAVVASEAFGLATRVADEDVTPDERALLVPLAALLASVDVPAVAFAALEGAGSERLLVAVEADAHAADAPRLSSAGDVGGPLLPLLGTRAAWLNRAHPRVRKAVAAAAGDAPLAALVLARLVLLAEAKTSRARDVALLRAWHALGVVP